MEDVTVEPIMKMRDPVAFARAIAETYPRFVNIGADSKGTGLVEPTLDELMAFLNELAVCGVPVRRKTNLGRLLGVSKAVDGVGVRVLGLRRCERTVNINKRKAVRDVMRDGRQGP